MFFTVTNWEKLLTKEIKNDKMVGCEYIYELQKENMFIYTLL